MIIHRSFTQYTEYLRPQLDRFCAHEHWAKIEIRRPVLTDSLQKRLELRFPVEKFNSIRQKFDPKGIMSNELYDKLMPIT